MKITINLALEPSPLVSQYPTGDVACVAEDAIASTSIVECKRYPFVNAGNSIYMLMSFGAPKRSFVRKRNLLGKTSSKIGGPRNGSMETIQGKRNL